MEKWVFAPLFVGEEKRRGTMLKQEFEAIAMNGKNISIALFEEINIDYMKSLDTKQEFIRKNYGFGNTADDVLLKYAHLSMSANREALRDNPSATPAKLEAMDSAITIICKRLAGVNRDSEAE
jgi:hypothetical protein